MCLQWPLSHLMQHGGPQPQKDQGKKDQGKTKRPRKQIHKDQGKNGHPKHQGNQNTKEKKIREVTVAAFRPELQRAAGDNQHAAMTSNGTVRMAQKVQTHLQAGAHDAV